MTNNDTCPLSDSGNHRYFIFKVAEVYEPAVVEERFNLSPNTTYYQKVEYAISGCNCGSSIKQKVEQR